MKGSRETGNGGLVINLNGWEILTTWDKEKGCYQVHQSDSSDRDILLLDFVRGPQGHGKKDVEILRQRRRSIVDSLKRLQSWTE